MARLNQIEIRESEVTYDNQRDWFFHPTGHHVVELILHFLPRDYVLDGSSKFSVNFGPRDEDELGRGITYEILGVRVYHIEDFDVEDYMTLPPVQQQEVILNALTDAMLEVAQSTAADHEPIRKATEAVRDNEFQIEIPIEKLDRSTKDRQLRVRVFRLLGPHNGETWEARICRRDGTVIGVEPITDEKCSLDRTSQYTKSRWDGSIYEIVEPFPTLNAFSFDIRKYQGGDPPPTKPAPKPVRRLP